MRRFCFSFIGMIWLGLGSPALGQVRVLCLGDSLTEGYMLSKAQAWPALVETALTQKGYKVTLLNAGISGSTTASGSSRLQWHLKGKEPADILILALGANDGLRGLDVAAAKKNLLATVKLAKQAKMSVLLVGMRIPPNYGAAYSESFHKIFGEIATEENIPLVPFLLEGVGGEPNLNLPDGIHPNEKGYKIVAETMLRALEPLLKERLR
mgnify:CR=1 FL=1